MRKFTSDDKLQIVEHFIEQWRPARNWDSGERDVYLILKAIADDIRARSKTSDTIALFDKAIDRAQASKTALGYNIGNLREIAELTIGRWPTIRQALQDFEQEKA